MSRNRWHVLAIVGIGIGGIAVTSPALAQSGPDACVLDPGQVNTPPVLVFEPHVTVPVDDDCNWTAEPAHFAPASFDAEGHPDELFTRGRMEGLGLQMVEVSVDAVDTCGAESPGYCLSLGVPVDVTDPTFSQNRARHELELADGRADDVYDWTNIARACGISWADNCSQNVVTGIVAVTSNDADETIEGEPGLFWSDQFVADWAGGAFCLDGTRCGLCPTERFVSCPTSISSVAPTPSPKVRTAVATPRPTTSPSICSRTMRAP